jgi:hypothetical protein
MNVCRHQVGTAIDVFMGSDGTQAFSGIPDLSEEAGEPSEKSPGAL